MDPREDNFQEFVLFHFVKDPIISSGMVTFQVLDKDIYKNNINKITKVVCNSYSNHTSFSLLHVEIRGTSNETGF